MSASAPVLQRRQSANARRRLSPSALAEVRLQPAASRARTPAPDPGGRVGDGLRRERRQARLAHRRAQHDQRGHRERSDQGGADLRDGQPRWRRLLQHLRLEAGPWTDRPERRRHADQPGASQPAAFLYTTGTSVSLRFRRLVPLAVGERLDPRLRSSSSTRTAIR